MKEWSERDENSNVISYPNSIQQRILDCKRDFIAEARRLSQLRHPNIVKVSCEASDVLLATSSRSKATKCA